jgi:DNA-binding MarR family transcriptional regulator
MGVMFSRRLWIVLLACILVLFAPLSGLANSNPTNSKHFIPTDASRNFRQPNSEHEPTNDVITGADTVTYDWPVRIINGTISSGDPGDHWKIPINRGVNGPTGSDDPIKLIILLDDQGISGGGCYMTMYDAEFHELGKSSVANSVFPAVQGNFTIVGQVNSSIYIKVQPNSGSGTGGYQLKVFNTTEDYNPADDDNNRFATAVPVNITVGETFNAEYLDYEWDNADFYTFDAIKGQKIKIDLTILSAACDFDIYLFDGTTPETWIKSSATYAKGGIGSEQIIYLSPTAKTYYLRVVVKIDGTWIGDRGNYKLEITGNLPPFWNSSHEDEYVVEEDSLPIMVLLNQAFFELNPGDVMKFALWDETVGAGAYTGIPTTLNLGNATIELKKNGTTQLPFVRITPKTNKFGNEIIQLRATDEEGELFTFKNITLKITPVNDLPILNGTNLWLNGNNVNPGGSGSKITGFEGKQFETKVTGYDPADPWDTFSFYDNTDLFDIHPKTGAISFLPTFHINGDHTVIITIRDNGTAPNETSTEFTFSIEGGCCSPIVNLLTPKDNGIQYTLEPEFFWEQTNEDFFEQSITYEFFLSTNKNLVTNRDKSTLNATLVNTTYFEITEPLTDKTKYYWTVIPNDGLHLGKCESGVISFETDVVFPKPEVQLKTPKNNQMIETSSVFLTWELYYAGTETVKYDLYFDVSLEGIENRNATPYKAGMSGTSIEIKGLYPDRSYFWQVIPWTPKVQTKRADSEIWSFYVAEKIPKIQLLTPVNQTLQYNDWVKLTWEIDYPKPDDLTSQLTYYSIKSPKKVVKNLTKSESYTIFDLPDDTYYWRIVPFISTGLRGAESEWWSFSIYHSGDMLGTRLLDPVNITIFSQVVTLSWEPIINQDIDYSTLSYDVYLDNSTNIPWEMELVSKNTKSINYLLILPMELGITYYWYVIPHAESEDANIQGFCSSGVVYFELNYDNPKYDINIHMLNKTITLERGNSATVYFELTNHGNRRTNVDISVDHSNGGNINITLKIRRITLGLASKEKLELIILALPNALRNEYTVTIKATTPDDPSIEVKDSMIVTVDGDDPPPVSPPVKDPGSGNWYWAIAAIIVVIVILLSIFIFSKLKRHRLLEHQRREMIVNYVTEHPGEHFRGIQKALQLEVGVIAHHINKLERGEFIKSRQDGQYRRFYPMDAKIDVKLILSHVQENILKWIKRNPGIAGSTIATQIGVDRKLVTYHINVLQNAGFIYTEKLGREKVCYSALGA